MRFSYPFLLCVNVLGLAPVLRYSSNNACIPPSNSTFLAIGQSLAGVEDYSTEFPLPAAVMTYTNLSSLHGLSTPVDYGGGVQYASAAINPRPGSGSDADQPLGLQLALDLGGLQGLKAIVNGTLDKNIRDLVAFLETTPAPRVFLRIGYEFDNPSFGYTPSPSSFVSAFRRIVTFLDSSEILQNYTKPNTPQNTASNNNQKKVLTMFHSYGQHNADVGFADKGAELDEFYPGDDFVDWVAVSLFRAPFPWMNNNDKKESLKYARVVSSFSRNHKKPFAIAESTVMGGLTKHITFHSGTPWKNWFQNVIDFIRTENVKLWCYISEDWEKQRMWKDNGGWGDTRIEADPSVMQHWIDEVVSGGGFLQAPSLATCGQAPKTSFLRVGSSIFWMVLSVTVLFVFLVLCRRNKKRDGYTRIDVDDGIWYVERA